MLLCCFRNGTTPRQHLLQNGPNPHCRRNPTPQESTGLVDDDCKCSGAMLTTGGTLGQIKLPLGQAAGHL